MVAWALGMGRVCLFANTVTRSHTHTHTHTHECWWYNPHDRTTHTLRLLLLCATTALTRILIGHGVPGRTRNDQRRRRFLLSFKRSGSSLIKSFSYRPAYARRRPYARDRLGTHSPQPPTNESIL
jgi:hypothetical protein|uniref:Uncharacterized protein n=1 Tax=Sipha flava TaxID=143950 RepID=A0A2S2Q4S4_9HEMI